MRVLNSVVENFFCQMDEIYTHVNEVMSDSDKKVKLFIQQNIRAAANHVNSDNMIMLFQDYAYFFHNVEKRLYKPELLNQQ